ncbi:unnamed protein product [Polarella glacialis]|uniref:Uncharacterized protein n=1 Tax=Polarella glacialis TaxID=89957 RepID=A0A813HVD1_POLGL|nr:unnamed protein product [Polarella glacialis]
MYFPPVGSYAAVNVSRRLWAWQENIMAQQPARTLSIILVDANARLGASPLLSPEGYLQVGGYGNETQNTHGRIMREFLQQTNMTAINALHEFAAGPTWHNTRGHSGRIDYILSSVAAAASTVSVKVDHALGFQLLLPNTAALADHSPIIWTFSHPCPHPGQRSSVGQWTREQTSALCSSPALVKALLHSIQEWSNSPTVLDAARSAVEEGNVDSLWDLINDGCAGLVGNSGYFGAMAKFPSSSWDVTRLLTIRWQLRQQMADLLAEGQIDMVHRLQRTLTKVHHELGKAQQLAWLQRQQQLASEMKEAAAKGKWRMAWASARRLAQQSLGPKGRVFHQVPSYMPTAAEWADAMSRSGPDGGCDAHTVWESDVEEFGQCLRLRQAALAPPSPGIYALTQALDNYNIPLEQARVLGDEDLCNTRTALTRRTGGFASPWSLPKDIWRFHFTCAFTCMSEGVGLTSEQVRARCWIGNIPERPPKGKGKGKNAQPENPAKRTKTENPGGTRQLQQLAIATSQLCLQNSKMLRLVFSLGVSTTLVPAHPILERASHVEFVPSDPLLADVHRWAILVTGLAVLEQIPSDVRAVLTQHGQAISSPAELLGQIQLCTIVPTFADPKVFRVQVKVSSELETELNAVLRALAILGGTSKFGPAPRTAAERLVSSCLRSENPVLFEDGAGFKFREVLGAHFRKIVELTEKFSTIDSYLQHDGEVAHKSLSSLTDVHAEAVKSLETQFNESLTSCFFDGHSVVHEVAHYRILYGS